MRRAASTTECLCVCVCVKTNSRLEQGGGVCMYLAVGPNRKDG